MNIILKIFQKIITDQLNVEKVSAAAGLGEGNSSTRRHVVESCKHLYFQLVIYHLSF